MRLLNRTRFCNLTGTDQVAAAFYGVLSLALFVVSVALMVHSLYHGLQNSWGQLRGWTRTVTNLVLIAQFPALHSALLSKSGRRALNRLAPRRIAQRLQPTTYVLIASLQLIAFFLLWTPSGEILWEPQGAALAVPRACFAASWVLLGISMWQGHLGVQLGYIGWLSVWKRLPSIAWPGLPTKGIYAVCRQPIYFSFMLTLWTGPVWSADKLEVAVLWSLYCLIAPVLKERRQMRSYGEQFQEYRRNVPYWPGFKRSFSK